MGKYKSRQSLYPMKLIYNQLGDLYWPGSSVEDHTSLDNPKHPAIVGSLFNPKFFGGWQCRERGYLTLRHKLLSLPDVPPLSRWQRRFWRVCRTSWHRAYWMHMLDDIAWQSGFGEQMREDLKWAASRPTSLYSENPELCSYPLRWMGSGYAHDAQLFYRALTGMERVFLRMHGELHGMDKAVQPNQRPDKHAMRSGNELMFTLIRNMELVWYNELCIPRWMFGAEALESMHFRMQPRLREMLGPRFCDAPLTSFHHNQLWSECRTNRSCRQTAGNSMDVWCVLVAMAHHWYHST